MKRFLYSLCLVVSLTGMNSCKDKDPEPVSPVVGRWELNRGQLSGFASPYQTLNTVGVDFYNYDFGSVASRIDIRADKSFTDNTRSDGFVADANGTWEFVNTELTLNYEDGTEDALTYSSSGGIEELTGPSQSINFPVSSTATAPGQLRVVYRK